MRHSLSITFGTPRFEKTTTAQIKSSNVEEHVNILKIIHLKSILKLLVPFVIKKKPKDSVRMDLHVTITISMI